MSVLSWGKCSIRHCESFNGIPTTPLVTESNLESWTLIDTPKEDTTKLTTTQGNEVKATEEGGATIDVRYNKSEFELEFDIFVKKGSEPPFQDDDGVIVGEEALVVIPEDTGCEGILIERAHGRCDMSYSTADGILLHYVFKALKPNTGKMVKLFNATSDIVLDTRYTVTAAPGTGDTHVTVTPSTQQVRSGHDAVDIELVFATGYELDALTDNGTDKTSSVSNGKYSISDVAANHTVVVTSKASQA